MFAHVVNEDCMATMGRLPDDSVDLVITSPPYNMNLRIRNGAYCSRQITKEFSTKYEGFDDNLPIDEFYQFHLAALREMLRIAPLVFYNIQVVTGSKRAFFKIIGDLAVVLTILAAQHGWDIQDCIQEAYDEIKDRRGVLLDGIFVKERDLIHPDLTKKLDTLVERYHKDGQAYIADWADGNAPIAIINNLLRQRGIPAAYIVWERDGHEWSISLSRD